MNNILSDWFWKKLSLYFGWLATIVLFILVIFAANIEIKDLDLWLHMASGRYILEHLQIPRTDIFSATVFGKPWINHEWLFQIIVYSAYSLGGLDGLITLQVLLVGITFLLLLFLGDNREQQAIPIMTLLLVVLVYQLRFFLRPEIFSLLFFVLYISALSVMLSSRSSLWIMFGLQVLWVNIHGFFILGPFLVLLNIIAEFIKRRVYLPFEWNDIGRLSDEEYVRLKQVFLVVILACFINPYGIHGAYYPLKILFSLGNDSRIFFEHIGELSRPFTFLSFFNFGDLLFYKLLIIISAVTFLLNYRRLDMGLLIFWLFFLVSSFLAERNIVFFAFVAYFVVLANMQHVHLWEFLAPQFNTTSFKSICSVLIKAMLIFAMLQYIQLRSIRGYYDFDTYTRKSEHGGVSLRNYPYKAVDFLLRNGIEGRFFNDFNSGAYLIGRTSPHIKVFIDGRTELYGGEFFKQYMKIWKGDTALFDEAVQRYELTGAFLNSVYVPAPKKTIQHLYNSRDWVMVYFDYDAAIFLRDIPSNRPWIEKWRIDLSQRQVPKAELFKIKGQSATPYRYTNRAQTLYHLGLFEQAQEEAREALKISPTDAIAYKIMGMVALKEKRYLQALEWLRHAKILDAGDTEARFYLAKAFYHLGEHESAREQVKIVLNAKAKNRLGMYLLSQIYEAQGNREAAQDLLEKVRELDPKDFERLKEEFE